MGDNYAFVRRTRKRITGLWRSALKTGKIEEALLAAEHGQAQALSDTLIIQYKFEQPLSDATFEETVTRPLTAFST